MAAGWCGMIRLCTSGIVMRNDSSRYLYRQYCNGLRKKRKPCLKLWMNLAGNESECPGLAEKANAKDKPHLTVQGWKWKRDATSVRQGCNGSLHQCLSCGGGRSMHR
jgi:hypothetical protein